MDKNLNELLKWSIQNQTPAQDGDGTAAAAAAPTGPAGNTLSPEALAALFGGGPSDAELMKASMDTVTSTDPEITLESKLVAFDNFEQLIESLDNANNMAKLALWTPLLGCLAHEEQDIRRMAAWCVGTAVQNNEPSQERLLAMGDAGIPALVSLATGDGEDQAVRRKAVYALSSAVRNYQPAMDVLTADLAKKGVRESGKVDAVNMDEVDKVMDDLKAKIPKA
ncbi:Hsp70 nucleotide exchange factor fes-1 [Colletotrichum sidae]|uniref:Hsp70 nucleotide exchange factor fes-1 n=3 Tax=Colletotrichum orbiculare species complex TaxID=2707354 RepID=N4V4V2_COLOR|nr:Hsp70 nucleotide exchange factor fes-1 [Colletotrichum orbiculare MAFF 240422]TDZ74180.1 Hsp70 nucleotide exchange factor fes-1 [Colletotrichum trifolii]TEA11837.1 Hsp70 nucleotide exchange factor fes-1 [Colletotrichum sidae]